MKFPATFSRRKFQSLDPAGQIRALVKLLQALEQSIARQDNMIALRDHCLECISWMEPPLPEIAEKLAGNLAGKTDQHQILQAIDQFHSAAGLAGKDSQFSVLKGDGLRPADPQALSRARKVVLILDNLRSAFNVGSIFRSAECLGLAGIWLCGVTATPDNPTLDKTARETAGRVAWQYFPSTLEALDEARSTGYRLYALETTTSSQSAFETDFELPLALVVGNESLGISPDILNNCPHHVSLPVLGWKNSLNVAVACAVCAYQIIFGANAIKPDKD